MVGPTYDCVANPLGAVRLTFEKAIGPSGSEPDPSSFDGKDWGVVDLFRHFLLDQSNLSQVPVLNKRSMRRIPPKTLVRFRGMVQDMLGNEFYVGAYKDGLVWRTNKYSDVSQFPIGSSQDTRIWDRRLLYCVPVPGLNSWADYASDEAIDRYLELRSQQRDKRTRMDVESADHDDVQISEDLEDSPHAKKMKEQDGSPSPSLTSLSLMPGGACSSATIASDFDQDSFSCLVKIYDSPESDLKLNDVFEFVGVLAFDSEFTSENGMNDEFDDMVVHMPSDKVHRLSSKLVISDVPRLHCIVHRKLAVLDFLSSLPTTEPKPLLIKEIREALLRYLTAILGNDGLAAQFMLLHLLSKIHVRVDNVAVGKLALNLTCLSKETVSVFGRQLDTAFKDLLPFTNCIPLTVECLNTASFAPKKDYQSNRLMPGVLQLPEGSHIIFDETQLETGTLSSVGVENARSLKNLIECQKVEYDFVYYKIEMAADVQLLILSEGKSNMLPADVIVPFKPSSGGTLEVVDPQTLVAWRWYLATIRSLTHCIDPQMQKVVENDLVAARQADRKLGSEDFSRWLTMGRLIAASFGDINLSLEHWQMVKELERLRRERIE